MLILIALLVAIPHVSAQASQWIDSFQKTVCHDRWAQMDWQSIVRPCQRNMVFGKNKLSENLRTSTKWSHTLGLHFKKTGEFSKIAIQTRTGEGRNKEVGGDTWRVFIRGADRLTPFVSDLNNGVYEAKFVTLQPGFYKAEIALQSSLCEGLKDPPQDWLVRDSRTLLADEKGEKLVWEPIRGGNISFKIDSAPESAYEDLKRNFYKWQNSCGQQYKCQLLWSGFGRWVNSSWQPYVEDTSIRVDEEDLADSRCLRSKEGVLKLTGDEMTDELMTYLKNSSVCTDVFQKCVGTEKDEQPRISIKRDGAKKFSTKNYLNNLKRLLGDDYMDEKSALLVNYGHPFVQNLPFKQYRSFIDRAVKILKAKYRGKAVWRTMAVPWRASQDPEDRFMTHQRIKLFNAYATSAMCNAGIPVLDVFQMTESAPTDDKQAVAENLAGIISKYFRLHTDRKCEKKHRVATTTPQVENQQEVITDISASDTAIVEPPPLTPHENRLPAVSSATVGSLFTSK